jgi:hypothetical protein
MWACDEDERLTMQREASLQPSAFRFTGRAETLAIIDASLLLSGTLSIDYKQTQKRHSSKYF